MFKSVQLMNVLFGNVGGDAETLMLNPADEGWERVVKQCNNIAGTPGGIIKGEVKELQDALIKRDFNEIRDALCDIMVFTLGAYHMLGVDAEKDMRSVISALMSRFCKNDEELRLTKEKYAHLGVELYEQGNFPYKCLKSTHDQTGLDNDIYPKGKFVKCVNYSKPVFYSVL